MKRYLTCLFLLGICLSITNCSTDDVSGEIPTQGAELVEIPDAAFGEYLVFRNIPGVTEEIQPNGQVKYFLNPDEVVVVSDLSVSKTSGNLAELNNAELTTADIKITDLTGIEYFVGLQELDITSNDITSLDITQLTGLEVLGMNFNLVSNLDVSQNTELTEIRYRGSAQAEDNQKLTNIDLSNNTQLRSINFRNHNLTSIDLTNNTQIDELINLEDNPGPDGDPDTGDIIIPAAIFNQLTDGTRIGVISDADVVTSVFLSTETSLFSEDNGEATFTLSLNQTTDSPVEVTLNFSGSATLDTDFTISSQPAIIPAGELETSVTLNSIQDIDIEGDETITISLGNIINAEAGENQEIDIVLEDDDFEVPLILNEILYDPPSDLSGDSNNDGVREAQGDEFIELYNNSDSPLDISGFEIYDADNLTSGIPKHIFPDETVLPPNSAIVIFGSGSPNGSFGGAIVQTANGEDGNLNLNNSGDTLTIRDNNGVTVLTFDIEPLSNNPDESYTRNPDITGEFEQHAGVVDGVLFSPGTRVDGTSF